jgi:hypothetical protein
MLGIAIWECIKALIEPDPYCHGCGWGVGQGHAPWCEFNPTRCKECSGQNGHHADWCKRKKA